MYSRINMWLKEKSMQNKAQQGKTLRIVVAAIAILIGVAMAVYGFMTLPAEVATQFEGFLNTGAPPVPKVIAVLLPFALVVLYAIRSVSHPKSIFLCLFGYILNVLFWLSN